ncbi:MAG: hypothetical protein WC604_02730 [Candidatus Gracilibacteria bacterium]
MPENAGENQEYKALVDTVEEAEQAEKQETPEAPAAAEAGETPEDLSAKVETAIKKGEDNIKTLADFMGEFDVNKDAYAQAKLKAYGEEITKINDRLKSQLKEKSVKVNALVETILKDLDVADSKIDEVDSIAWGKVLKGEITMEKAKHLASKKEIFKEAAGNLPGDTKLKLDLVVAIGEGKFAEYIETNRDQLRSKMLKPPQIPEATENKEGATEIKVNFQSIYTLLEVDAKSDVAKIVQKEVKIANLFTDQEILRIVSVKSGTSLAGTEHKKNIDVAKFFSTGQPKDAEQIRQRGLYTAKEKYIPIFDGAVITFVNQPKNKDLEVEGKIREEKPKEAKPAAAESATEKPAQRISPSNLTEAQAVGVLSNPGAYKGNDLLMESAAILAPYAVMNNLDALRSVDPALPKRLLGVIKRSEEIKKGKVVGLKEEYKPEEIQRILESLDLPEYRNNPKIKEIVGKVIAALKEKKKEGAQLFFKHIEAIYQIDAEQAKDAFREFVGNASDQVGSLLIPIAKFLIKEKFDNAENLLEEAIAKDPITAIEHMEVLLDNGVGVKAFGEMYDKYPIVVVQMSQHLLKSDFGKTMVEKAVVFHPEDALQNGESLTGSEYGSELLIEAIEKCLRKGEQGAQTILKSAKVVKKLKRAQGYFLKEAAKIAIKTPRGALAILEAVEDLDGFIEGSDEIIKHAAQKVAKETPEEFLKVAIKLKKFDWMGGMLENAVENEKFENNPAALLGGAEVLLEFEFGKSLLKNLAEDKPEILLANADKLTKFTSAEWMQKAVKNVFKKDPILVINNADKLAGHDKAWTLPIFAFAAEKYSEYILIRADKVSALPYAEELFEAAAAKKPNKVVINIDKFEKFADKAWVRKAVEEVAAKSPATLLMSAEKLKKSLKWVGPLITKTVNENPGLTFHIPDETEAGETLKVGKALIDRVINSNSAAKVLNAADKLLAYEEGKAAVKKWAEIRPDLVPVFIDKLEGYEWVPDILKSLADTRPEDILVNLDGVAKFDRTLCASLVETIAKKHPKIYKKYSHRVDMMLKEFKKPVPTAEQRAEMDSRVDNAPVPIPGPEPGTELPPARQDDEAGQPEPSPEPVVDGMSASKIEVRKKEVENFIKTVKANTTLPDLISQGMRENCKDALALILLEKGYDKDTKVDIQMVKNDSDGAYYAYISLDGSEPIKGGQYNPEQAFFVALTNIKETGILSLEERGKFDQIFAGLDSSQPFLKEESIRQRLARTLLEKGYDKNPIKNVEQAKDEHGEYFVTLTLEDGRKIKGGQFSYEKAFLDAVGKIEEPLQATEA